MIIKNNFPSIYMLMHKGEIVYVGKMVGICDELESKS